MCDDLSEIVEAPARPPRPPETWRDRVARALTKARLGGPLAHGRPDVRICVAVHCIISGKSPALIDVVMEQTGVLRPALDYAVHVLTTDPDALALEQAQSAAVLSSVMAAQVEVGTGYRYDEARSDAEALERVWRKGWVWAVLNRASDLIDFDNDDDAEAFMAGHAAFLAEFTAFLKAVG